MKQNLGEDWYQWCEENYTVHYIWGPWKYVVGRLYVVGPPGPPRPNAGGRDLPCNWEAA